MRQDTDVARVAAALRAPAIRYRSFGNEPVRTPLPAAEPDPYALLGAAMNAAAEISQQQGLPASEPWQPPDQQAQPQQTYQDTQAWSPQAAPASPESYAPQPVVPESPVQPWPAPSHAESWAQPPAVPSWPAPAAKTWPEPEAKTWPAPEAKTWPEPEAKTWPAQPESTGHEAPVAPSNWADAAPPVSAATQAAPQPLPAPSLAASPATAAIPPQPAPASTAMQSSALPTVLAPAQANESPGWIAAPPQPVPVPAKPPMRVEPASYGVADMSLLRAADAPAPPAPRPALSTLSELSVAPPVKRTETRPAAPRALFPLIEALDLPGGLMARRGMRQEPEAEPLAPEPELPPPPVILGAADIDLPLAALLRLLASDAASSAEGFLALRGQAPSQAPGHASWAAPAADPTI